MTLANKLYVSWKLNIMFGFCYIRSTSVLLLLINFIFRGQVVAIDVKVAQFEHYNKLDNYKHLGHVSGEMTDISPPQCGRECTRTSDCQAFAYNINYGKCLYSYRRTPNSVRMEEGWKYYLKPLGNSLH